MDGWRGERKEKKVVVVEEEKGREKEKRGRGEERGDQRNVGKERKRVTQIVRRRKEKE